MKLFDSQQLQLKTFLKIFPNLESQILRLPNTRQINNLLNDLCYEEVVNDNYQHKVCKDTLCMLLNKYRKDPNNIDTENAYYIDLYASKALGCIDFDFKDSTLTNNEVLDILKAKGIDFKNENEFYITSTNYFTNQGMHIYIKNVGRYATKRLIASGYDLELSKIDGRLEGIHIDIIPDGLMLGFFAPLEDFKYTILQGSIESVANTNHNVIETFLKPFNLSKPKGSTQQSDQDKQEGLVYGESQLYSFKSTQRIEHAIIAAHKGLKDLQPFDITLNEKSNKIRTISEKDFNDLLASSQIILGEGSGAFFKALSYVDSKIGANVPFAHKLTTHVISRIQYGLQDNTGRNAATASYLHSFCNFDLAGVPELRKVFQELVLEIFSPDNTTLFNLELPRYQPFLQRKWKEKADYAVWREEHKNDLTYEEQLNSLAAEGFEKIKSLESFSYTPDELAALELTRNMLQENYQRFQEQWLNKYDRIVYIDPLDKGNFKLASKIAIKGGSARGVESYSTLDKLKRSLAAAGMNEIDLNYLPVVTHYFNPEAKTYDIVNYPDLNMLKNDVPFLYFNTYKPSTASLNYWAFLQSNDSISLEEFESKAPYITQLLKNLFGNTYAEHRDYLFAVLKHQLHYSRNFQRALLLQGSVQGAGKTTLVEEIFGYALGKDLTHDDLDSTIYNMVVGRERFTPYLGEVVLWTCNDLQQNTIVHKNLPDLLKKYIARDVIPIEKKGKDKEMVKARYLAFFCTNYLDLPQSIDRRLSVLRAAGSALPLPHHPWFQAQCPGGVFDYDFVMQQIHKEVDEFLMRYLAGMDVDSQEFRLLVSKHFINEETQDDMKNTNLRNPDALATSFLTTMFTSSADERHEEAMQKITQSFGGEPDEVTERSERVKTSAGLIADKVSSLSKFVLTKSSFKTMFNGKGAYVYEALAYRTPQILCEELGIRIRMVKMSECTDIPRLGIKYNPYTKAVKLHRQDGQGLLIELLRPLDFIKQTDGKDILLFNKGGE